MTISAPPTPPDDQLRDDAATLVNALLDSTSTDHIPPKEWWDRAASALRAGAAASTTWDQLVSKAARKLQVETLQAGSGRVVAALGVRYGDAASLAALRGYVAQCGVYAVAVARVRRDERRAAARTRSTAPTPPEDPEY